jgi:hypothetical protein
MFMPDTVEVERKGDQDDNFLSHTNVENTSKGEQDTAIDDKNKEFKDTYIEDVIAMETFWALYAALYDIDEVYAQIKYQMSSNFSATLKLGQVEEDCTYLSIRENMEDGKSPTFMKMAALVAKEYGLDYIAKTDDDVSMELYTT